MSIVSYNLHGFNQGFTTIRDPILSKSPNVFLIQEHWLIPDNLSKLNRDFDGYFAFGSSAMSNMINCGVWCGRPFRGVATLINVNLRSVCTTIASSECYCVIKYAIYSIRSVIDEYVAGGSTFHVCALNLSKAFDRMNHFALFIKLMNRNTPVNLLAVIEKWFSISVTCVKWGDRMSIFLIWCQVVHYPHPYSLYMWMILIKKLFPVVSAVICYLFSKVFFCMPMIYS